MRNCNRSTSTASTSADFLKDPRRASCDDLLFVWRDILAAIQVDLCFTIWKMAAAPEYYLGVEGSVADVCHMYKCAVAASCCDAADVITEACPTPQITYLQGSYKYCCGSDERRRQNFVQTQRIWHQQLRELRRHWRVGVYAGRMQTFNHFLAHVDHLQLIGVPAVCDILMELTAKCKADAGVPDETPLAAFGACMSGFLESGPQQELIALFNSRRPGFAHSYYIDNDSPGSIFTAAGPAGGCVIISGTGQMGQVITGGGKVVNCGGHGHMYGDGEQAPWSTSTGWPNRFRMEAELPPRALLTEAPQQPSPASSFSFHCRGFCVLHCLPCHPPHLQRHGPLHRGRCRRTARRHGGQGRHVPLL